MGKRESWAMMPSGTLQPRGMKHWRHCWSASHREGFPPQSPAAPTIKTFKNHFKPQTAKTHRSLPAGKGRLANFLTETTSCQGHPIGPGGQRDSKTPETQSRWEPPCAPYLEASIISLLTASRSPGSQGSCGGSYRSGKCRSEVNTS